jgi:hypothetical protein
MTTQKVGFGEETYFELLDARPDMGVYFALGESVIVVVDGVAYEVTEGAGGPVVVPPTATSRPVASNPARPTSTPDLTSTEATPAGDTTQSSHRNSGPLSFCPSTVIVGLALAPLAGVGLRRRRRG